MGKPKNKRRSPDDIAKVVADIAEVEPRYVNMVRDGERKNATVELLLVEYHQGKNKLIEYLKELVPLEQNTGRYARQKN